LQHGKQQEAYGGRYFGDSWKSKRTTGNLHWKSIEERNPMVIEAFASSKSQELLNAQSNPCVSIYLPTHPSGKEAREDRIRYRNLVGRCEEQFHEQGFIGENAARMLAPALALINTDALWNHPRSSLAVFISPNVFRAFTLPHECREQAHVGTHFYIKPLIPVLSDDGEFWVLGLSRGRVDTLFIDPNSQAWGTMNNGWPVVHDPPQKGDEELLDLAARYALSSSGLVFAFEPGRLPSRGPASAVFRY
jgi:hypothetical protein